MSRKYNVKHIRNRSNEVSGYRKRLIQRGLSKAPMLADVDTLRLRQDRRIRETCSLEGDHDRHDPCNGVPFPFSGDLHESDYESGGDE
jgi:hypothetical protein